MSKHHGNFYCLNCFHCFATENKRESHEKVCKDTKILEFNQNKKSDKAQLINYSDLECLIEKIYGCKNDPENSST